MWPGEENNSQAWWWECHGLGLHECCRHWGATVYWGNHEYQNLLWQTEAEHNPSLQRLGRRELFQHDNDHCLANEAEDKGNLWCILKRKMEECKVSKIHQFRDVIVEMDSSGNMWSSGELHAQEG